MNAKIAPKTPDHLTLVAEQDRTLETPRRKPGLLAWLLFFVVDLVYGRRRSLEKFKVIEIVARVPYQTWEHTGYIAVTHTHMKPGFARRIFDYVEEARAQQDNEQWHLLILEELLQKRGAKPRLLRDRVIPQLLAMTYYQVSWLMYVLNPRWSYELNADFEDHAEHEYMRFVQENPDLEREPFLSQFEADYGRFNSLADMLRNIGVDERHHKEESLVRMMKPRFA